MFFRINLNPFRKNSKKLQFATREGDKLFSLDRDAVKMKKAREQKFDRGELSFRGCNELAKANLKEKRRADKKAAKHAAKRRNRR